MPALIHAPANAPAVYPYGLTDLRRDNPNTSFPANPTADDLAPFDVFEVEETQQPAHDPRSERIEESEPAHDERGWRQQWRLRAATPEEVAAYDEANQPPPNWARFKRIALGSDSLNSILVAAYQVVPVAAGALAPALLRAESGDNNDFAAAWGSICQSVPVPAEVIAGFVGVAQACHLPAEFAEVLAPREN